MHRPKLAHGYNNPRYNYAAACKLYSNRQKQMSFCVFNHSIIGHVFGWFDKIASDVWYNLWDFTDIKQLRFYTQNSPSSSGSWVKVRWAFILAVATTCTASSQSHICSYPWQNNVKLLYEFTWHMQNTTYIRAYFIFQVMPTKFFLFSVDHELGC
jgi:hypothetical protein